MKKDKMLNVRIPAKYLFALQEQAKQYNLSMSHYIRLILVGSAILFDPAKPQGGNDSENK